MAKDAKFDGDGDNCEDEMVVKSICSKNLNRAINYLTPNAKQVFT